MHIKIDVQEIFVNHSLSGSITLIWNRIVAIKRIIEMIRKVRLYEILDSKRPVSIGPDA